jgi:hypothetical protein
MPSSFYSDAPVTLITPLAKISFNEQYDEDATPKSSKIRRLDHD